MAQNFLQRGDTITAPAAPYALEPGDGCLIGSLFGVSENASDSGAECVLGVSGVWRLAKVLTDAFTVGAPVYWDNSVKVCTASATGTTRIGVATAAAAANSTVVVDVRLSGAW